MTATLSQYAPADRPMTRLRVGDIIDSGGRKAVVYKRRRHKVTGRAIVCLMHVGPDSTLAPFWTNAVSPASVVTNDLAVAAFAWGRLADESDGSTATVAGTPDVVGGGSQAKSMILAIDPSTTRTGYAIMDRDRAVHDGGFFLPNRTNESAIDRANSMCEDLAELLNETEFEAIVVEVPTAEAHHKKDRFGKGLTTYGIGVGMIVRTILSSGQADRLAAVDPATWTGGDSKIERAQCVAISYAQYREVAEQDPGLGLWYIDDCRRKAVTP